jgi:hypothetical protein
MAPTEKELRWAKENNVTLACAGGKEDIASLRTVLDFAFVTEELILGLKCGIIIVTDLLEKSFRVQVSTLGRKSMHKKDLMMSKFDNVYKYI